MAEAAWVAKGSAHSVAETLDRLEKALTDRGFHIMARVDHGGHAQRAGLGLRPTQVLLFGNPALGTQLMLAEQTIAIDLPSKALAWQDEAGAVHLGYRDLRVVAAQHPSLAPAAAAVAALAEAIGAATDEAVGA